jgi:hypothetical protein
MAYRYPPRLLLSPESTLADFSNPRLTGAATNSIPIHQSTISRPTGDGFSWGRLQPSGVRKRVHGSRRGRIQETGQ